jgi:hypothetical protein
MLRRLEMQQGERNQDDYCERERKAEEVEDVAGHVLSVWYHVGVDNRAVRKNSVVSCQSTMDKASIAKRLARIRRIADDYFSMETGTLIERPGELLRLADVRGLHGADHPHKGFRIYLSRKALKHFVEERKEAFLKYHSEEETLEAIHFAIDHVCETIIAHDRYECEPKQMPPKYFYAKDYSHIGRPYLRVIVDANKKAQTLEIRSIHFQTRQK